MSAPSSISRRRTFWPSGPVWCVTSCMPRIWPESERTSSIERASLTPPPLPRPPAWICAFTTQTGPPSCCAACTASSTENAGMPRGTGTPNLRNSSLPWYSWIFTCSPGSSSGAAIPFRIIATHGFGGRLERMAAVELERLGAALVLALPQAGEGLDGGGRQVAEHLGQMRAAVHMPHRVVQALAKSIDQVGADERAVGRTDAVAGARIGHAIRVRFDVSNLVRAVDRDPHPHVVDRLPRRTQARQQRHILVLHVDDVTFDVEESIVALEALVGDVPRVEALAGLAGR